MAANDIAINATVGVRGETFLVARTITPPFIGSLEVVLPAAKTATLTTRTSDTAADLTGQSGHGVTTGQTLDVYWEGGCQYGCTVGTVAGLTIPISGGTGDALPIATTALTIQVPVSTNLAIPANSLSFLLVNSPVGKTVTRFRSSVPTILTAYVAKLSGLDNRLWDNASGAVSPLGATANATVLISSGSTTTQSVRIQPGYTP